MHPGLPVSYPPSGGYTATKQGQRLFAESLETPIGTALSVLGARRVSRQAITIRIGHIREAVTIIVDTVDAVGFGRRGCPAVRGAVALIFAVITIAVAAIGSRAVDAAV